MLLLDTIPCINLCNLGPVMGSLYRKQYERNLTWPFLPEKQYMDLLYQAVYVHNWLLTCDAILLGEYTLMNKEEMELHNKVGDICSELRDGYVSNSNTHDLLYAVLELFESDIDKRLKWLSWFWELVSADGLTEVLTEMLPEI